MQAFQLIWYNSTSIYAINVLLVPIESLFYLLQAKEQAHSIEKNNFDKKLDYI